MPLHDAKLAFCAWQEPATSAQGLILVTVLDQSMAQRVVKGQELAAQHDVELGFQLIARPGGPFSANRTSPETVDVQIGCRGVRTRSKEARDQSGVIRLEQT